MSSMRPEARLRPGSGPGGGLPPDASGPLAASLTPTSHEFLEGLVKLQLVGPSAVGLFLRDSAGRLDEMSTREGLANALLQAGLLTAYQLDRVLSGNTNGLVIGNYRVLEKLGAGSMGVVFLAEHSLLKRRVAIKVLPVDDNLPPAILERFFAEMRVLADLHHPNIVMAFDAGRTVATVNAPAMHYLVLELVSGGDMEQYVIDHGVLPIAQACTWIRQAACGLQEAHDHHLVHRDVKPSNLLLTDDNAQVKLVDFGLARRFVSQLTDPSCLLGSIEFMAPEQSFDPSAVGPQADIYGLGASLFWVLAGQTPYPEERSLAKALRALQYNRPRHLRSLRPDAPEELDGLIDRMLARDPAQRPALPVTVMNALTRFTAPVARPWTIEGESATAAEENPDTVAPFTLAEPWKVLLVHDNAAQLDALRRTLEPIGCVTADALTGAQALTTARAEPCDLIVLQRWLPDIDGLQVCKRLSEHPPKPNMKILVLAEQGDLSEALAHGADDCIPAPPDLRLLSTKTQHLLHLKEAQDRAQLLARDLMTANRQLEDSLSARAEDVRQAHDALLYAMAKMAESRDGETAGHCRRLQLYCRTLGQHLSADPAWAGILHGPFLDLVERCVPLHDIGKIGLPDTLLSKPGKLTSSERSLMETHTLIGASMLDALARQYGQSLGFLAAATVIVRHHHERYDGHGYPDGLAGDAIPPAARIVALADVYDALRRKRFHKPALTHEEAARTLVDSEGQFDPAVVTAFAGCEAEFKRVYQQVRD